MKESLSALQQFISDFNLRQSNGVIAFRAALHFDNGQQHTDDSEVHIITSDNIGAVYFLSLDGKNLPDMFSVTEHPFTYVAGECLKIESPVYTVTVSPTEKIPAQ